MSRIKFAMIFCGVLLSVLALREALTAPQAVAEAQEPNATEQVGAPTLPALPTPEGFPTAAVGPTVQTAPDDFSLTATALSLPVGTLPDVQPTAEPPTLDDTVTVLLNARLDMELLATQAFAGERPRGWSGSTDFNDPQIGLLIRLDLELFAGTAIAADQRPVGWFGPVASSGYFIARDIRHDLELLADAVVSPGVRPNGWVGGDPVMRCDRETQALVGLLERAFAGSGNFVLQSDPTALDFCTRAAQEASVFAEVNLLTNATTTNGSLTGNASAADAITPLGNYTVAFLDRNVQQRVGVVPEGTSMTVAARSYVDYSQMILVRGEGFEVFVDYATTTLSTEAFDTLPNVDGIAIAPFCSADWCVGG